MNDAFYSIRMRASLAGKHVSGAERIVREEDVARVKDEMYRRANGHGRGVPDSVVVTVDSLAGRELISLNALPVTDMLADDCIGGVEAALSELVRAGVSDGAARFALGLITKGAAQATMYGAMVVDADTGKGLLPGHSQGLRVRMVDYDPAFVPALDGELERRGLHGTRLKEALALATKVSYAPGAVAELCVSDNPGYQTGYVASVKHGYVRITPLKDGIDKAGGRVFFVDRGAFEPDTYIGAYIRYMRETPVLVVGPLTFHNKR
jgi:6-carboxyhexanoate--CoA ligase